MGAMSRYRGNLFAHLSICLSIYLSVCLFVYPALVKSLWGSQASHSRAQSNQINRQTNRQRRIWTDSPYIPQDIALFGASTLLTSKLQLQNLKARKEIRELLTIRYLLFLNPQHNSQTEAQPQQTILTYKHKKSFILSVLPCLPGYKRARVPLTS